MDKYLKIGTYEEICDAYNNGELGEPFVGYDPEDDTVYSSIWDIQVWVYTLVYNDEENENSFKFAGQGIESLPLGYTIEHNDYVYAGTTLYYSDGFYYLNSKGDYQKTAEYYFEQDASSFTFVVEEINDGKETIKTLVFHPVLVENNKDDK